jgi:hypothetical protein
VAHTWLDDEVADFVVEYDALKSGQLDPAVTKRVHLDMLGVVNSMRNKAARGQLEVGADNTFPVRVMSSVYYVLEMRPKLAGGPRPPRLFRLYYAEPAEPEGALLPLVLSTKPNGVDAHQEQNASIAEAKTRSRVWQFTKAS